VDGPPPTPCLTDDTILGLIEGSLPGEASARADEHMAQCVSCRQLVADSVKSFLSDPRQRQVPGTGGEATQAASFPAASNDAPTALVPGQRVGRYVIQDVLGFGGMGVVYAAFDPSLNRKISLKLLREDQTGAKANRRQAWLVREAQAMAQLSHPNVVTVHDVGTYAGQVFIAMELVRGQTLKDWLDERSRTMTEILEVFLQAGAGLSAAHAAGIVHRDFKPSNVLVGTDGRAKVTDFGLACPIEDDPPTLDSLEARSTKPVPDATFAAWRLALSLTETGVVKGTPAYMAPEQFLGEPADARTDQFSYCVALYEALFKERPFGSAPRESFAERILSGRVNPLPADLSAQASHLRELLVRGLRRAPQDRFATMDQLLTALRNANSRDGHALRRRAPYVGMGVAVCIAVVLFGVQVSRRRESVSGTASTASVVAAQAFAAPDVPSTQAPPDSPVEPVRVPPEIGSPAAKTPRAKSRHAAPPVSNAAAHPAHSAAPPPIDDGTMKPTFARDLR
jgi:hypothetical protein